MTQLKKTASSIATAFAGAALLLSAAPAQAAVMASSIVDMTNFIIRGSDGIQLDRIDDFAFLTFTSSAGYTGESGGASFDHSSSAAPLNFAPACVGSGCGALGLVNDVFPKLTAPVVGNYAAADQLETGSPVTGINGFSSPAHVASAAYAGLNTAYGLSSADANNNLNSSFIFKLNQSGGISFSFDIKAYLQVALTADETFPGFASSSYDMSFSILNLGTGATVYNYTPDLFGDGVKTLSLNAPLPMNVQLIRDTGANPVSFSSTTPVLLAGQLYQLSARTNTNVDVQRVPIPEPSSLALMGLGLLGMSLRMLKRRQG